MNHTTNLASSRLDLTRQMLDELDALMAKMLDAPTTPTSPATPAPTIAATLTVIDANNPAQPTETVHVRTDLPIATELGVREPHRSLKPAVTLPPPANTEPIPPSRRDTIDALIAVAPVNAPRASTNWLYLPLRAFNAGFDLLTLPLGPLGAGVRTPNGRFLLGYAGLAMLLFSAAWWLRAWYWSR